MAVTLTVPAVLRRYSAGAASVTVTGNNVGEALEGLFSAHPDLRERILDERGAVYHHLVLFRNDVEIERALEAPLEDGDVLEIVAAAVGG